MKSVPTKKRIRQPSGNEALGLSQLDTRGSRADGSRADDQSGEPKHTDRVINVVSSKVDLFHDARGTAYAAVPVERRRAVLRLGSKAMRAWIAKTMRSEMRASVGSGSIEQALVTLDGIARFDAEELAVHVRVAEHDGSVYIDLGDASGACVEVTPSGWSVRESAPVMFRRPEAMHPLPRPVRGGTLEELRPFVNLPDDDSLVLFAAWLVAAFLPGRSVPILALHGEQGTAKSTVSRVARRLVDPNASAIRALPRNEDDLIVASTHSHVIVFDNVSGLPPWLSDALCRLTTGGGLSKRALYTDDDEVVIDAKRPIVLNGIDDLANRADFAERCIALSLERIPDGKRRDEESFWRDFEVARPRILGVLFDGLAAALRGMSSQHVEDLPRMADFAKCAAASEPGLRLESGTARRAYRRNRERLVDVALEGSPLAIAVRRFLAEHQGAWSGAPSDLLRALSPALGGMCRSSDLPRSASALSAELRRIATFLRVAGIELNLDGTEGRGSEKRKVWTLTSVARS